MPNMRLTEQEAVDVTAYLVTFRNDPYQPPPAVNEELVGEIVIGFLARPRRPAWPAIRRPAWTWAQSSTMPASG